MIAALVSDIDDRLAMPIDPSSDALRLLASYVPLLLGKIDLTAPLLARAAVAHVHDLAALAVGRPRDSTAGAGGIRAARLSAIRSDIVENLASETLSVAGIAARHGVTARYIQMLFEAEGQSFSQYVLGLRLATVHRALGDPRNRSRTIAALAYEAGFGDLSYFNLAFKRRYGITPSETRFS
jgi:AraC-like DNA-binding protein